MTGWLVYQKSEVTRNKVFIDKWMQAAALRHVTLHLIYVEDLAFGVQDNLPFLHWQGAAHKPDFVVMRVQQPLLSLHVTRMGIPCYNNAEVARICNDKRLTHLLLQGLVPMMDTAFLEGNTCSHPFAYPVVVKAAHSCGGRHVFLCRDDAAFAEAVASCAPDGVVVQPLCDTPGKDVRVYVLGNRIITSMMRFSSDGDFRSNLGQGGDAVYYPLDSETNRHVKAILGQFSFGLCGIDFIFHQGKLVFNEIEDAVGTRMLYIHTDIDIVRLYLDYILDQLTP